MANFVDLHCHWVPAIDDGARSIEEGVEILRRLSRLGFSHVVATPHMRPGMFDNDRVAIEDAYLNALALVPTGEGLPAVSLAAEHYFSDVIFERALGGDALPYVEGRTRPKDPRRGALLVEFHDLVPLSVIEAQLFRLQTEGYIPVIAHPERYRSIWTAPEKLARLVELGSFALLDVAAVVGKYGREAEKSSRKLLELGVYHAACTDSHRPEDVDAAARGIDWVTLEYGAEEVEFLFAEAPLALLRGQRPSA